MRPSGARCVVRGNGCEGRFGGAQCMEAGWALLTKHCSTCTTDRSLHHPPTHPHTRLLPQVGQQPLELLRLSTLRDFLRCEFAEFVADPAEQQQGQQGQQGQAASATGSPPGVRAGSSSEAEGGSGQGSPSGVDNASGSPAQAAGLAPAAGSSQGGGNEEGEVDLVTGERKRVHPSVLRRLVKKAAKQHAQQHAQQEAQQAQQQEAGLGEPSGSAAATPTAPAAAGSGGSGGKAGARFDFERM